MTTEQKQCLLYYLGYYTGKIDGDWGTKSKEATENFQRAYNLDPDGVFGKATKAKILEAIGSGVVGELTDNKSSNTASDWWKDVKYFDKDEFECHCNGKYCNGFPNEPDKTLIMVAERTREHFNAPILVSSGVRCTKHNGNVGGVSNSRHLLGKAMDFCVKGVNPNTVLTYVQKQPEIRYAYVIDSNYVHMDVN